MAGEQNVFDIDFILSCASIPNWCNVIFIWIMIIQLSAFSISRLRGADKHAP
jgi:hypothetical protein